MPPFMGIILLFIGDIPIGPAGLAVAALDSLTNKVLSF
jgi:hypothetical protein